MTARPISHRRRFRTSRARVRYDLGSVDFFDFTDLFEFLDYFVRPWRFLVSHEYRSHCFVTWNESSWWKRLGLAFEAGISLACGVVIPAAIVYGLVVA